MFVLKNDFAGKRRIAAYPRSYPMGVCQDRAGQGLIS